MMRKLLTVTILVPLMLFAQNQDCVFDKEFMSGKLGNIGKKEVVQSMVSDEESMTASILLTSGELIHIEFSSCESAGLEARSFYPISVMANNDSQMWVDRFLAFGKLLLSNLDFMHFSTTINRTNWVAEDLIGPNTNNTVIIEHETYPLFEASIRRDNDIVIFYISYYMN